MPLAALAQGTSQNGTVACDIRCVQTAIERAIQLCVPRIEAEAPGDYDWLYRPIGGVFKQADTPEAAASPVARYRGDNVRFQNARGAWVRVMYECGYDTAAGRVAYVRIVPGVLGKAAPTPVAAAAPAAPPASVQARPAAPQSAVPTAPAAASVNVKLIGEPSFVDVRQIPPGAKPKN